MVIVIRQLLTAVVTMAGEIAGWLVAFIDKSAGVIDQADGAHPPLSVLLVFTRSFIYPYEHSSLVRQSSGALFVRGFFFRQSGQSFLGRQWHGLE